MHPEERPTPEGSLPFASTDVEMRDASKRTKGLLDLPSEVLCMIMKEISDDLKHKGEPSDRRLYALGANVSQELYEAVVAYQGGCKKIKVTAVSSGKCIYAAHIH